MDMLDFSALKPQVFPFKGPDGELYEYRSATAGATIEYRTAIAAMAKYDAGRLIAVGSNAEAEFGLVANCVFKGKEPVGRGHIQGWGPQVIDALADRIKAISPGLTRKIEMEGEPEAEDSPKG